MWAVLLLVLGAALAVLEVFFPSAGILAFLSAAAVVAAIVMGFWQGVLAGVLILVAALLGLPTVIVLGFKYWPKTAMGRRILLMAPHGRGRVAGRFRKEDAQRHGRPGGPRQEQDALKRRYCG